MEFTEDALRPAIEPSDSSRHISSRFGFVESLSATLFVVIVGTLTLVVLFPAFAMSLMTRRRVENRPIAPIRQGKKEQPYPKEVA